MKTLFTSLSLALILLSCGSSSNDIEVKTAPTVRVETIPSNVTKTVANIMIEGVSCDGCRSKITKEIKENECVAMAVLSPSDTPGLDLAVIEYDTASCDHNTFVDVINTTVGGKYTATDVTVLHMEAQ